MAAQGYLYFVLFVFISCYCFGFDFEETTEDRCSNTIKGCYCTETYIDCNGAELSDISEIYPYITSRTFRIHITGGTIRSLPNNMFTLNVPNGPLEKVTYLNLSRNTIENIGKTSFNQLPNLKTLDLSDNDLLLDLCEESSDLALAVAPLSNLEELYLRHIFSKETSAGCDPGNLFSHTQMNGLTTLDLSGNDFDQIGPKMENFLCEAYNIKSLNLSRNSFYKLPVSACMTNLVELDISHNQIPALDPDEIDVIFSLLNLQSMKMGGNPFSCDCFLENTFKWINSTSIPLDFHDIVCAGNTHNDEILGKPINELKYSDICQGPDIAICFGGSVLTRVSKKTYLIAIASVSVAIISAVVVVVVVCRRRRNSRRQHTERDSGDVKSLSAYSRMPEV